MITELELSWIITGIDELVYFSSWDKANKQKTYKQSYKDHKYTHCSSGYTPKIPRISGCEE